MENTSARPDPQAGGGEKNLAQKPEEPHHQQYHGNDEKERHRQCDVETDEGAEEEYGDDGADQQGGHGAEGDGQVDQLGPAREDPQVGGDGGTFRRGGGFQPALQGPGPVDYPAEAVGHDTQDGADGGKEEDRGNCQLDGVGNVADVMKFAHARTS